VLRRFSVGSESKLLELAAAIDNGDRHLELAELIAAGQKATAHVTRGYRATPSNIAAVMRAAALGEETALLREAKKHDNGDRVLSRSELERAAEVLKSVVAPNDVAAITQRTLALRARGIDVEELGVVSGQKLLAAHFPNLSGSAPKLRVIVTGGVHGNEPCGAGAALFLAEWLASNPKMREHVEFSVVPAINPRGLLLNTRETPEHIDLNRTGANIAAAPAEMKLVDGLLSRRTYDLGLDLHAGSAERNGFWLIHNGALELLTPVVGGFVAEFPILTGDPSPYRRERPGIFTSENNGTLKELFVRRGAKFGITVEAPKSVSYLDQVMGEVDLVQRTVAAALARA
jgi:hypothetical protein